MPRNIELCEREIQTHFFYVQLTRSNKNRADDRVTVILSLSGEWTFSSFSSPDDVIVHVNGNVISTDNMALNGLLLLTSSLSPRSRLNLRAPKRIFDKRAQQQLSPVLYVVQWLPPSPPPPKNESLLASLLYSQGNAQCPAIDLRVLLPSPTAPLRGKPTVPIDLVLVEGCPRKVSLSSIQEFVKEWFSMNQTDVTVQYLTAEEDIVVLKEESTSNCSDGNEEGTTLKMHDIVALGGTFDRMHNAHKILLTEAVLRCNKEIIVGVTSDEMIKSKLLFELIEPCEVRLERVRKFLADVSPHLKHRVVMIDDPFGPTITEKDVGLIVVSAETIKGAEKINEIRKGKGFRPLDIHHIVLFNDVKQNDYEEDKISSSSQRIRILGDRLRPPNKTPSIPYVIGLTGGIASGKSTLCSYLETIGLPTINCDLLGHEAYKKGTQCFSQIVETFGEDVLNADKTEINRKVLGGKVFNNPTELQRLTSIVWPEIRRLAEKLIADFAAQGHKAVVLDAAVLLEAGWDQMCHDVWVVVIPKEEACKRAMARDNISKEDAERRIAAQVSNHERAKRANFIFSSLWDVDFTRRQADKAWEDIKSIVDKL